MILEMLAKGGDVNYFKILFLGGETIGFLLWAMSLVVVGLSIHFFLSIRRATIMPEMIYQEIEELFEAKQYREVVELTEIQPDFFSYTINSALVEAPHGYPAMERAMEEAAEERTAKMLRNIEWLNLMANVGPMLGLLGTVWGMIGAFFAIVKMGSPEPAVLAGDIGVALVTTLLGLAVSIPAMSVFSILRNRIDALTSESIMMAQSLIATFRPTARQ